MADKIDKKTREWCEAKIYEVMDIMDPTKSNSDHYKAKFAKMSNNQFYDFIALDFPYRFHVKPFEIEPNVAQSERALKALGVPLFEKVNLPYLYKNQDGVPVNSKECIVGYLHIKKVQQCITKKNSMSTNITSRDMKTGRETGHDKNGQTSDREMEALAAMSLFNTMKEFSRPRADAMNAKNSMYNTINTKGEVSIDEIPIDQDDSLGKNLMDAYLIGCHLKSNMISDDYYTAYTIKEKRRKTIERV